MKLLLTIFLTLFIFSNDTEDLYGNYWFTDDNMMLSLGSPDSYTLFVIEQNKRSGGVTSREFSRGTFDVIKDTLRLYEDISNNERTLLVESEERLKVLNAKGLANGDIFLCRVGYYANGNPKFEGSWRRGKKHGTWVYFDEKGNVKKTVEYKNGKVRK